MRSLRTTLVLGLTAIAVLVVAGFAGAVYARARSVAHEETAGRLRLHAGTLAGLLEIGRDGIEFEAGDGMLPEYRDEESGFYAAIHAPSGKTVVRSPSLGKRSLPAPPPWVPHGTEGWESIDEIEAGPDGHPCAVITRSFVARVEPPEGKEADGWSPPAPEALRYRIQVAHDVRERDRGLTSLAWFLGLAGAGVLATTIGCGFLLARLVLRPIHRMTREAATLTPGDATRRLHPSTVVRELHSLAETLNSALDRLGEALERQRRFTSDASHELRTPVSVLLAGNELLLRRPRSAAEYREGLERQARTIRRMKEIIENLLALARADAAGQPVARERVDLVDTISAAVDELRPLAEEKGLVLGLDADGRVPVRGDPKALAQLAGNLLSNAIKFTPPGGRVTARVSAADGDAVLVVEDTGPGIPPEHLPHVFERFYRVNEGRDGAEGAGLGLAIAEWIVKAHGGTISAGGLPGGGAAFRARLPLDADAAEFAPAAVASSPAVGGAVVAAAAASGKELGP